MKDKNKKIKSIQYIFSVILTLALAFVIGKPAYGFNLNLPLVLSPSDLPEAYAGGDYSVTFTVSSGQAPYTWDIQGMPANCQFIEGADSSHKILQGVFTTAQIGSHQVTVAVSDSSGREVSKSYSLVVSGAATPPVIITSSLTAGKQGQEYVAQLQASGGVPAKVWSLVNGDLPEGVVLYEDGLIYGIPVADGEYSFTVRITDACSQTDEKAFTLKIAPTPVAPLVIKAVDQLNAEVGINMEYVFQYEGGTFPCTWTLTLDSDQPEGLSLEPNGFLMGTPSVEGTYRLEVMATDKLGQTAQTTATLTVSPEPFHLLYEGVASFVAGLNYEFSWGIPYSGGASPYTFSISSGCLPEGLSLDESSGLISGTPVETGTFELAISGRDSSVPSDTVLAPILIKVSETVAVDLKADKTAGPAPLTVRFSDQSIGPVAQWEWDFDDDGRIDSTEQNPSYTYREAGIYSVALYVTGADGQWDVAFFSNYIQVKSNNGNDNDTDDNGDDYSTEDLVIGPQTQPAGPGDEGFTDIAGHWAEQEIDSVAGNGLMNGYPDETFKPDEYISRIEVMAVIARALKIIDGTEDGISVYADAEAIPVWARAAISAATKAGLVKGYPQEDGSLRLCGDQPISRAELAVIFARIVQNQDGNVAGEDYSFVDCDIIPAWAREGVQIVYSKRIMTGFPDNSFQPGGYVTRAQAAVMIYRLLNRD